MRFSTNKQGRLELRITDVPDWEEFEKLATDITKQFGGRILARIDDGTGETRYWDIEIERATVTLHLQHYLGICLFAETENADRIVRQVGEFLTSSNLTQ